MNPIIDRIVKILEEDTTPKQTDVNFEEVARKILREVHKAYD